MNKKLLKNYFSWFFYLAVIAFVLIMHGPRIYNNFKNENQTIAPINHLVLLSPGTSLEFPLQNKNSLIIFWASWCAPCKLEMNRLKKSVEEKKISPDQIFAINPFEEKEIELAFIKKEKYPFIFLRDELNTLKLKLKIEQTPTVLLFEKTHLKKISSGISLTGIFQAETFLSP